MHPEMARMLADQHRRELTERAELARRARLTAPAGLTGRRRATASAPGRRVLGWRVPRYRVSWSRTTLSPAGSAGRRGRSWVIVISATRGL